VNDFQIVGPDWMTRARFDISAKLPPNASTEQIPEMLRALLAERFKLEIRRETKEQDVYALLVANSGANLKPAEVSSDNTSDTALGPDGKPREPMMYALRPDGGISIRAPAASLASLVWFMSLFTARPVIDLTNIPGKYEFKIAFAAEKNGNMNAGVVPPPDGSAAIEPSPSVFQAVKQYGLRVEARKVPIEMIVVIHVEKMPTEN
jgi:uncharacterized protein (TIGR03435 family)